MDRSPEIIVSIAKHLGVTPQDIDLNASLEEDLGLGPLEKADLLSALANEFQVTFNPAEVDEIRTVNDLVEMVEDLLIE